jgi:hypothetical protein
LDLEILISFPTLKIMPIHNQSDTHAYSRDIKREKGEGEKKEIHSILTFSFHRDSSLM